MTNPVFINLAALRFPDNRPRAGSMKEKLAKAVIRRIVTKIQERVPDHGHASIEDHVEYIWRTDEGLLRGRVLADVHTMLTELTKLDDVNHAFLDKAREGLPMESGLAAKFWLQAIRVLKEDK